MQKSTIVLLFLSLLTIFNGFSQVVIGDKEPEEKTEKKNPIDRRNRKTNRELDSVTQIYFNTNWSTTYRNLKPNGDLFGDELGTRADETAANFWSFGFGLRNQLSKHFTLEVGLGLARNGEKYAFDDPNSDSSFNYTNRYTFITMPIVGYYTYGKEVKFLAGAGLMPQLFMNQRQEQTFTSAKNTKGKEEIITKSGTALHNSFAASAVFRVGVQLSYSPYWSIYFMPEYRLQLSSTYGKTTPFVHKATAIGFNLGLTYQL